MATVLERNTLTSRERPSSTPARISSRARGRLALGALIVAIGVLSTLRSIAASMTSRPCCS